MTINKESAVLNIREGLKKIQSLGLRESGQGGEFKECWFMLIQKSINAAAQTLESSEDI
jgi:hypothetical protein